MIKIDAFEHNWRWRVKKRIFLSPFWTRTPSELCIRWLRWRLAIRY